MSIFPTKWRANEQQGEGWAPTSCLRFVDSIIIGFFMGNWLDQLSTGMNYGKQPSTGWKGMFLFNWYQQQRRQQQEQQQQQQQQTPPVKPPKDQPTKTNQPSPYPPLGSRHRNLGMDQGRTFLYTTQGCEGRKGMLAGNFHDFGSVETGGYPRKLT